MFHRRRLQTLIIALLLATLPCVGLASFVREAQPACAMHMHGKGGTAMQGMSAHCKAMAHGVKMSCPAGSHCAMCDDLSISLAVNVTLLASHALAVTLAPQPVDLLLSSAVANPWRPPRAL